MNGGVTVPIEVTMPPGEGWQPIATGPTTGPVVDVELWTGTEIVLGHYAYGDGEGLMPPYGPAWFRVLSHGSTHTGPSYAEIIPRPSHWRTAPTPPGKGWQPIRSAQRYPTYPTIAAVELWNGAEVALGYYGYAVEPGAAFPPHGPSWLYEAIPRRGQTMRPQPSQWRPVTS